MLKQKLKECSKCHQQKIIWSSGRCKECTNHSNFDRSISFGMASQAQLKRNPFKKVRKKKSSNKKFFESMAAAYQDNPVSFESGKNIGVVGNINLAHIFPKETYKSLAHEPLNIILLTWEEHTRFDELLGAHEFDKLQEEFESWSKICNRVKVLLSLCEEQGNLRTALENYLNQI